MKEEEEEKQLIQCLFDFKAFYKKKGHKYFPGTICFPQYFAYAINSIFQNLYAAFNDEDNDNDNIDEINLCYQYFNILPVIIDQLYGPTIKIDKEKLIKMSNLIKEKKGPNNNNYLLLETYLRDDDESVINYRKALLKSVLSYHECETANELIDHLSSVKCCYTKEKDIPEYPSSEYYLLMSVTRKNNVNVNELFMNINQPTKFWGPFYWNVFHSIAEKEINLQPENKSKLIDFICVLPYTLPCSMCTFNYIDKMTYFLQLIDKYEKSHKKCIKTLYEKIHDKINYETYN